MPKSHPSPKSSQEALANALQDEEEAQVQYGLYRDYMGFGVWSVGIIEDYTGLYRVIYDYIGLYRNV